MQGNNKDVQVYVDGPFAGLPVIPLSTSNTGKSAMGQLVIEAYLPAYATVRVLLCSAMNYGNLKYFICAVASDDPGAGASSEYLDSTVAVDAALMRTIKEIHDALPDDADLSELTLSVYGTAEIFPQLFAYLEDQTDTVQAPTDYAGVLEQSNAHGRLLH